MRGVKYIGPVFDGSGYAEAARNNVLAMARQGCPVTLAPVSFDSIRPDLGENGAVLRRLVDKDIPYDIVIIHCTPDIWRFYAQHETDKYVIGCTIWETTRLHPVWTAACNRMHEVWVPTRWNSDVFRASGVTVPLYDIPYCMDVPDANTIETMQIPGVSGDDFVFYAIFQWQERKNPLGLIATYLSAFTGNRKVALVLKSYLSDYETDQDAIKKIINAFKAEMNLAHYPKIIVLSENFSRHELLSLHRRGDCFALLQRSEGWGLPHFEAAACGNPVVTPRYGAQTEFLNDHNAYLVDYSLRPVTGMSWSPYYTSTQLWCEPDQEHAMTLLRYVYENRDEANAKGRLARAFVEQHFTPEHVGQRIESRLNAIQLPFPDVDGN